MSFLGRLWRSLRPGPDPGPGTGAGTGRDQEERGPPARKEPGDAPVPGTPRSEGPVSATDEAYLRRLLHRLRNPGGREDLSRLGPEFYSVIDRLVLAGQDHVAIEVLGRLATSLPEGPSAAGERLHADLLLHLSELLIKRREYQRAEPLLTQVTGAPGASLPGVLRAHDLLAQVREAAGDEAGLRAHLEALVAEDLDYPRALGRLGKLQGREDGQHAPIDGTGGAAGGLPAGDPLGAPQAGLPTLMGAAPIRHQRYQLLRELGRGSAGTVYLAHDTELTRDLAVKIFHPGKNRTHAVKAWNEARLAAAVRHRGVVAVYDFDDERNLVVMELCTGGTLRQRLQAGRLPPQVALARTAELLDTLATIHRTGVVHGDLKPGNLLFRGPGPLGDPADTAGSDEEARYGDLVIADFGIARLVGPEAAAEAAAGQGPADEDGDEGHAAGTLGYLSPERRTRKGPLSAPSDLYALGAILLEMLLGALPVSRWGLLRGTPLPATLSGPAADELGERRRPIEALLGALLDEDPQARPDAAEALRRVLGRS